MALLLGGVMSLMAQTPNYHMEFGPVAGVGYYLGDAAEHVFMHPREVYGAQLRYKIAPRWAVQLKGMAQRIDGNMYRDAVRQDATWTNRMINLDVVAEYNFFRLGNWGYDARIKPFSPYIFLGVGVALYGDRAVMSDAPADDKVRYNKVMGYVPLGVGLKWKFCPYAGLNLAWQHNVYFADNIEGVTQVEGYDSLDNSYDLNGSNWLNCDATGQLVLGLVVEFGRVKTKCRTCQW